MLREAFRILAGGGSLAVFDGDYATTTVALHDRDPLQACVEAAIDALVHDRFLVRRLPGLIADAGFELVRMRSHGYMETTAPHYMLTIIERGADALVAGGNVGGAAADALKAEAAERAADGRFFGHIAYASIIARKAVRS